jgi:hypothetical protein
MEAWFLFLGRESQDLFNTQEVGGPKWLHARKLEGPSIGPRMASVRTSNQGA